MHQIIDWIINAISGLLMFAAFFILVFGGGWLGAQLLNSLTKDD